MGNALTGTTKTGYIQEAVSWANGRLGNKGGTTTKPNQVHHYATNKSKTYTPQLEEIANRYGLDLDDAWANWNERA